MSLPRRRFLQSLPAAAALPAAFAQLQTNSGKARLRTAICAYSFREELKAGRLTYMDLVNMCVEHDVDGLDLTVYWFPGNGPAVPDSFLLPLRRMAYRSGVEIYSISIRTNMCQPEADLRTREVDTVKAWVDVAAKLGAGHIRVFGGNVPKGRSEQEAVEWVAEILRRASDYSGSRGVILGLENHGGITARAERIVEIVKKVDSPWVGVNADTGNFFEDAYGQFQLVAPYAVNVQFKSEIRNEKGERAAADWDRLTRILAQSGYKGYLALEYEAKADPITEVPRLTRELQKLAKKYSVAGSGSTL